jgi:polyisoprenoid-binding protein YceI
MASPAAHVRKRSVHRMALAPARCFCQAGGMSIRSGPLSLRTLLASAGMAFAVAMFGSPRAARADADVYRFDPVHSQIWFTADHQRYSKPQGRLRIKDGWFRFDPKDWTSASVDVVIDLASVDLGDAKWNAMVASTQFLDTQRWPTARYISTTIEPRDATHAIVHGELDFHGVRKPLDLDVTLNRIGTDPYAFKQKAGFSASATLDRFAFGMERYKEVVAATIELHFEIEGIRDRDAAIDKPGEP